MEFVKKHPWLTTFATLGAYKLSSYGISALRFLYSYCLRGGYNLLERYGPCWAVVTGATGGIGTAYCHILASFGFNVLLLGRDKAKLEELTRKLATAYSSVQINYVVLDFLADDTRVTYETANDAIRDLDIGLLVNVAGVGHGIEYQDYPCEKIHELVKVTCFGTALMTRLVVAKMLTRKQRSGILNISSVCSSGKFPYCSVYGATRAFLDSFATSLAAEMKHKIDVTTIQCGGVITQMSPDPTIWHTTAEIAVKSQLRHLGKDVNSHGYWKHYFHQKMWDSSIASWHKYKTMRLVAKTHRDLWKLLPNA